MKTNPSVASSKHKINQVKYPEVLDSLPLTRDVEAEAEAGNGSGGSGTFSVEAEAEEEARKFYRFRFHLGGMDGGRKEIGSALLRRRANRRSINIKK